MFCRHNFHIRRHFFAVGLFSKFRGLPCWWQNSITWQLHYPMLSIILAASDCYFLLWSKKLSDTLFKVSQITLSTWLTFFQWISTNQKVSQICITCASLKPSLTSFCTACVIKTLNLTNATCFIDHKICKTVGKNINQKVTKKIAKTIFLWSLVKEIN